MDSGGSIHHDAGSALFVHDLVRVELPYDAVAGAFLHFVTPEFLSSLVVEAWRVESEAARTALARSPAASEPGPQSRASPSNPSEPGPRRQVEAVVGTLRARNDGIVVSIAWHPAEGAWVPPITGDLEIAAFGPDSSHLHVVGLSRLPPGVTSTTGQASLNHRLTVALVRHVLGLLASRLEAATKTCGER